MSAEKCPPIARLMFQPRIVRSALKVSFVVGSVLNAINNGEQLWAEQTVSAWQAALNYLVPFCVSSYSAARNEAQQIAAWQDLGPVGLSDRRPSRIPDNDCR